VFDAGYGRDTIYENSTADTADQVRIGTGLASTGISYSRQTNDLVVSFDGTTDQLVIGNFLLGSQYRVETLVFSDGSTIALDQSLADQLVRVSGTASDDTLSGSPGYDVIYGLGGNDTLNGLGDNDILEGGDGNDVLVGGGGDDQLRGGAGDDTYRLSIGDGFDRISDSAGTNRLAFGAGISSGGLTLRASWSGTTHTLDVVYGAYPSQVRVDAGLDGALAYADFADGSTLTLEQLLASYVGRVGSFTIDGSYYDDQIRGTAYNDVITAMGGNDTMSGFAGDDVLRGGAGHNLLDGGAGNDTLDGSSGNDTYLFSQGYGLDTVTEYGGDDTVRFVDGLARADVDIRLNRRNLEFAVKGTGDLLVVADWTTDALNQVETARFADGTVLTLADLTATDVRGTTRDNTLKGTAGNDRLWGDAGNDTLLGNAGADSLDGGAGNDSLQGNAGNDTYLFTAGWGSDTIAENDATAGNTDTVAFGSGIRALDLVFGKSAGSLVVSRHGVPADRVSVSGWDGGAAYQTEVFRAADGATLLNSQVDQLIQAMAQFTATTGLSWDQGIDQRPDDVQAILAAYWQSAS
jgi:Ca2+-binding RTX toxin-like protein